ncbi:MAG: isoprenylcysteine carboxylmethyltransferase family protein [Moheibacter sp.]
MKPDQKDIFFVAIQFFLFGLFFFNLNSLNFGVSDVLQLLGSVVFVIGMLIVFLSVLKLNRNLSVFPTPKKDGKMIETGLYKYIRHPIYTGIVVAGLGFSVYSESGFRLIVTLLLLVLFYFKSKYEEQKLIDVFSDYKDYMKRTGRFLPKL